MLIRKKFKVESAHIVRNCSSTRCSGSIHGHSAVIEILFESDKLDNAGMVVDFGLLKPVKELIDTMDHTYLLWNADKYEFGEFIRNNCERWIEFSFNPSAEMLAIFIHQFTQKLIDNMRFRNNEGHVKVVGVIYHETDTGYAQSSIQDCENYPIDKLSVKFSPEIMEEHPLLFGTLLQDQPYILPEPRKQVKL